MGNVTKDVKQIAGPETFFINLTFNSRAFLDIGILVATIVIVVVVAAAMI